MSAAGPLILLAAGGTGGHMFPAQALAEALVRRGWRVKLSTDARGARYAGGFPVAVMVERAASATFARGGLLARGVAPARIAGGIAAAALGMARDRPAAVVGFGGYPAIPALAAARLLGLPRMIHEANGVLGRVNRLFAPRVHRVACGVWPTALPRGAVGVHTGNPVRAAVLAEAGAPYAVPEDGPLDVLVIGGSQGARVLSDAVPPALANLADALRTRLRVAQQAREEDIGRVSEFYAATGIAAEVAPFFADVARRIAGAQLVVSRSGAGSVADIAVIGRPSILVPFAAAAADHQTVNARSLVEAGAAFLVPERALGPEALSHRIGAVLGDPRAASRMAAAAHAAGVPDATDRLVAVVEDLARQGRRA